MSTLYEKHQHNLGLPISYLPNEILSKIFFDVRNTSTSIPAQTDWEHVRIKLADWINLTHVCRTWREIALNTPLLWSYIDALPSNALWIPELLRRSKYSPLTLMVGTHQYVPFDEIEKHFRRVRELQLASEDATLHTIFSSPFKFQNLETLVIFTPRHLPIAHTPGRFVLADAHLVAHRLRALNLRGCSIDWNSKFLQGLTHLKLQGIPNSHALKASDFALVLSKMPALETLFLCSFLHYGMEEVTNDNDVKVHLQHLRELFVKCRVSDMAQFLSCLVTPHSCKIGLSTGDSLDEICDDFRVILSWISNQFSVPTTTSLAASGASDHAPYIRTLHFTDDLDNGNFEFEGFWDVLSREQVEIADPILTFTVSWLYDNDLGSDLQTFFSLLPLDGVVFLDVIDFEVSLTPKFWVVAFGSIQTLKTVHLTTTTSNFWEALTPANSDNAATPFSALASVTVNDRLHDFQLVVNKLRLRSQLGCMQLQDLRFIYDGERPPMPIITQLRDLVSSLQFVDSKTYYF